MNFYCFSQGIKFQIYKKTLSVFLLPKVKSDARQAPFLLIREKIISLHLSFYTKN